MNFLQEYFYYTRAERNGAFILALLSLLAFLAPKAYPLIFPEAEDTEAAYQEEIDAFWQQVEKASGGGRPATAALFPFDPNTLPEDSLRLLGLPEKLARTIVRYREGVGPFRRAEDLQKIYTLKQEDYERLAPYIRIEGKERAQSAVRRQQKQAIAESFPFDPNTASEAEFQRLGLPARVAANIHKYRQKGGRFRHPEDFGRVYGLRAEDYERLAPLIRIGQPTDSLEARKGQKPEVLSREDGRVTLAIDINQATAGEWEQLRGIGPAYARRIIAFRDKLGGFAHVGQVAETYGLPDSTFQRIRPFLQPSPVLRKLYINQADAQSLQAHPYLNWKQANAIVAYRSNHGAFSSILDVNGVKALPPELVEKLAPYLEY